MNNQKNILALAFLTVFLIISIICNITFYQKLQTSNEIYDQICTEVDNLSVK